MAQVGRIHVDWPTFFGALAFILVGGGFALFGGWQVVTTFLFLRAAQPVAATLTTQTPSCDDNGCTYWPEFTLTLPGGTAVTAKTQFGALNYGWTEGSVQTVLYNPAYSYIRIPGADDLWLLGGGFLALGGFAFCIGVWIMARMTFSRGLR